MIRFKVTVILLLSVSCIVPAQTPVYKDASAPVEARVDDLLARMTLQEKVDQMCMVGLRDVASTKRMYGTCDSPFESVENIARISQDARRQSLDSTRLGIPAIQVAECLHGLLAYGATIFPQAIAQGSTWNPDLIEEMASAIAEEATAAGVDQALSPLFDLIRDARYGRNEECYSEDPYLTGKMGVAFVTGMQGSPEITKDRIPDGKIMCTAKHFAAYSIPWAGMNLAPASVGERELRSLHLVPFEMAVKEGNVYALMPSYNEIDGIPAHASHFLLTDVLRDEWNFPGYTFSDYGSGSHLYNFHKVAADNREAALMAVNAGLDVEAARPDIYSQLVSLVKDGKVNEELIDRAVRRILTAKFKAGLFEKRPVDPEKAKSKLRTTGHVELARKIAEESIVLLKNDSSILPLDKSGIKSIAVIGPNADQVQYGDYSYTRDNKSGVTILEGIKELLGNGVKVNYAKGCGITSLDKSGFDEAVKVAENSDVAVVVLGETSVILSGLGWGQGPGEDESQDPFTTGEGYDLTDINPLGVQRELVQAIHATGTPVVLVLVHGRPWSIDWEKENIPAILEAWYPGEKGGNAVANILFGEVNPSGRLNCTFPQSVGHIPVFYNHKPSAKGINREPGTPEKPGRDYVFSSPDPLFSFGHGLSYTQFSYSDMQVKDDVDGKDTIEACVTVTNTGDRKGKEVVQLYVNDKVSSVTTPVMELKGFEKIELDSGESKTVKFRLSLKNLGLWNSRMEYVTEPGEFEIMIGKSSDDIQCRKTVNVKI